MKALAIVVVMVLSYLLGFARGVDRTNYWLRWETKKRRKHK